MTTMSGPGSAAGPLRDDERALWKEVTRAMKPLSRKAAAGTSRPVIEDSAPSLEAKKPPPPPPAKQPKRPQSRRCARSGRL